MSELDDRMREAREAVSNMTPPADLWARVVERSEDDGISLHDGTVTSLGRPRRPFRLAALSIAACLLAMVAVVAVVTPDRQTVDATDPAGSPSGSPTTECAETSQAGSTTEGAQMKNRVAAPVATVATALALLGGCGDDGPTNLARGEEIELVGDDSLGNQTLDIEAEDDDGTVTGELRFSDADGHVVIGVECADTSTDGLVILGGTVTETDVPDEIFGLMALLIREGDPDTVAIWFDDPPPSESGSCDELVESIPLDELEFIEVEGGSDIETG